MYICSENKILYSCLINLAISIVWYFTGRNIPKIQSGQAIAQKSTAQSHMQQQQPNKHLQTSAEVVSFLAPQGIF